MRADLYKTEPLCFRVYFGSYHRGTQGRMIIDSIEREVCIDSEYHHSHGITTQTYLDCIDYLRKSNDKSFESLSNHMGFTNSHTMSVYHGLYALDLLNSFEPTLGKFDLNENNIMLWQKYKCSRFWKKYYNSDLIKDKFAKMGINYDEIEEDYDSGDAEC